MNVTRRSVLSMLAAGAVAPTSLIARAAFADEPKPKVRDITIAVSNMGMSGEWFSDFVEGYKNEAKKIPGVTLKEAQANFDPGTQLAQLKALVAAKPDGIIVNHAPNANALLPVIKRAAKQGTKVVTAELGQFDIPGVVNVQQHNSELALMGLNKMAHDLGNKGNIVVIWIGSMYPQRRRIQVLQGWLKKHPEINVVARYGNASQTTLSDTIAKTKAELNQHANIDAFWVTWDEFAQGVVQAEQAQHKDIPIYSVDVSNQDIEIMRKPNSPWVATAAASAVGYGAISLREIVLMVYGQKVNRTVDVPGALITQNNLPKKGESVEKWFDIHTPQIKKIGVTPFMEALYKA